MAFWRILWCVVYLVCFIRVGNYSWSAIDVSSCGMTRVIVLRNTRQTCANIMQFFCCACCLSVSLGLAFFQIVCVTWRVDFKWYAKFLLCVTFCLFFLKSSFNVLLLCASIYVISHSVCYIKTWDRENHNEQEALGSWDKKNYMDSVTDKQNTTAAVNMIGLVLILMAWKAGVVYRDCSLCVDIFKYSLINGRYL